MGSDDTLILIIAGGAAIAIAANLGGFRDYLNKAFGGDGGGGGGIIPIPGQSGNCYNSAGTGANAGVETTCWRNRKCGGAAGTTVAWCIKGRGRCTDAKKAWLQQFGCKGQQAYAYEASSTFDRDSLAAVTVS